MDNISSVQSEPLLLSLIQRVEDNRADLASRYFDVMREALFSSRAELHPSALKKMASDEVDALLLFLSQADFSAAQRGKQLHEAGFEAKVALRLSQVARQFLLNDLENHHILSALKIVDEYEMAVVGGFIQSINDTNKIERVEQERVLKAIYQSNNNAA